MDLGWLDAITNDFSAAYKTVVQPTSIAVGPAGAHTAPQQMSQSVPEGQTTVPVKTSWLVIGFGLLGLGVLAVLIWKVGSK